MDTASCRGCGRPIRWYDSDEGRVPLEPHPSVLGPNRFQITDDGRLLPVTERAEVQAYVDHRTVCTAR